MESENIFYKKLKLVSYNMHGFNQGRLTVDEMIHYYNPDVFLLQEHWLTPANMNKLNVFQEYFMYGCSAMTKTVETGLLCGRPFGGVSFLIHNSIRALCKTICCSDRFAIMKIANFIIVIYNLPCMGSADRFEICDELLNDIRSWLDRYPACEFIIAGDFNVDLDTADTVSRIINYFCAERSLVRCDSLFDKA